MASWKNRDEFKPGSLKAVGGEGRGSYNKLHNDDSMLQQENDRMVSELSTKVSTLKNIAIDLDKEAKYQNNLTGSMLDDFESTGGLLGSAMGRLNAMVASSSSNRKLMCYLVVFLVTMFFFGYFIIGRMRR